jgi:hypothetical protein
MVAVVAMRMMQVAIDQIVDVVAMRHRLVATARAMLVSLGVAAAIVVRGTAVRVDRTHGNDVLVKMIFVRVVKMAVVEIVHVALMPDRRMAAAGTVPVRVIVVDVMRAHRACLLQLISPAWATAFSTRVST